MNANLHTWTSRFEIRGPTVPMAYVPSMNAAAADNAWAIIWLAMENPEPDLLHWDVRTWKTFFLPGPDIYSVNGIVAESTDSAWVVGANEGTDHNMIAHWDGKAWQIITSVPFGDHDELKAIARVSNKELWAVGSTSKGASVFFEHWGGSKWELVDPSNARKSIP